MEETIINVDILPEILYRRISSKRVKVSETDGVISLIPLDTATKSDTPITDRLAGILEGAGVKTADDIKDMRLAEWL
jgi:hypothetical protein